ncbi:hypothetical protein KCU71_g2840, partial [Aureobasidium melanogenum]
MTPSYAYTKLAKRISLAPGQAVTDDSSYHELNQGPLPQHEAVTSRQSYHNFKTLLHSRSRSLHNPLGIITLVLILLCVLLSAWIAHLTDGSRRLPGDRFDELFDPRIIKSGSSIWDSERQSLIRRAYPVAVHSHNDYWRRIPLFEALGSGCISIEADVHLRHSDLLVGHKSSHLRTEANLRAMYLNPLERILKARNTNMTTGDWHGMFELASHQTVVLLVDLKTEGRETLAVLSMQLQPLRDLGYLTHWNGTTRVLRPLTVVATGNAPFLNNNTYRDIFWDAKLNCLVSEHDTLDYYFYNLSNSYYASMQWSNALSQDVKTKVYGNIAMQIEHAKARGLIARYWDTPVQPPNMRDMVWRTLMENGVGILNMDDMGIVRDRGKGWGYINL